MKARRRRRGRPARDARGKLALVVACVRPGTRVLHDYVLEEEPVHVIMSVVAQDHPWGQQWVGDLDPPQCDVCEAHTTLRGTVIQNGVLEGAGRGRSQVLAAAAAQSIWATTQAFPL